MNYNFLFLYIFVILIMFFYIKKQSSLIVSMTDSIKLIPTNIKLVDESPPETTRVKYHKNYITINGNENIVSYNFNTTLHHVKNIELISAVIPKSNYKLVNFS